MQKYFYQLLSIFLILPCLYGCSNSLAEDKKLNQKYKFVQEGELKLKLDDETTFDAVGPAISSNKMYFYNAPNHSVKVFNAETLELTQTIYLKDQGPHSVLSPMGITLFNDKVGLYEFYTQKIKLINDDGEVIDTIKTLNENLTRSGTLITAISPIIVDNENVYTTVQGNHLPNRSVYHGDPTIKITNAKTGTQELFLNYPSNYDYPISGGRQSIVAATFNERTKRIAISFPLDHDIYEVDRNGQIIIHDQKPTIFEGFDDHYFSSFNSIGNSNWIDIKAKFWLSYSYWALIYNPYDDIYIRFINLPISNSIDLENNNILEQSVRKYQAIIYDKDFNQIALSTEIEGIDLTLGKAKFFCTKDGLHIFAADQNDEDLMKFLTFKLKESI